MSPLKLISAAHHFQGAVALVLSWTEAIKATYGMQGHGLHASIRVVLLLTYLLVGR